MKSIIHLQSSIDDSKPQGTEDRADDHRWQRFANPPPLVPLLIVVLLMTLIGWQALANSDSHGWTAIIIASLVTVGAIVIRQQLIVRESRIQTSRLSHQIDRDPLTGLLNRRRIGQQIDFELAQAKTSGRALGLALIDIDNFKAVNDTHGHATGDQVLKSIAGILSRACRGSDIAARYAGDEFLLVLPGLDLDDAHIVGERLLKEVGRYRNSIAPSLDIEISISIGIAVSRRCEKQAKRLIGIADAAMYDAKDAGKNQLVIVDADTKVFDIEDHLRSDEFEEEVSLPSVG